MADPAIGSYLGVYYVLDGHHDEWNRWAVDQVNALHAAGRMFDQRDHIHTGLYRFEWEHRRDADGVPAELTLDHRFAGMVVGLPGAGRRGDRRRRSAPGCATCTCPACCPARRSPRVLGFSPLPLLADAPGDVPRGETLDERVLALCFVDEDPDGSWSDVFAPLGQAAAAAGRGVGHLGVAVPRHGARHRHLHRPALVGPVVRPHPGQPHDPTEPTPTDPGAATA